MRRQPCTPRPDAIDRVLSVGMTYHTSVDTDGTRAPYWYEDVCYELTDSEVDAIEDATIELHAMSRAAAEHVLAHEPLTPYGLPEEARAYLASTLDDFSLYGRFDLALTDTGLKLLEYNADTPTGLLEAAIAQRHWLDEVRPDDSQFNLLHGALVDAWARYRTQRPDVELLHLAHVPAGNRIEEDWVTTAYLRQCADEAGWETRSVNLQGIGYDEQARTLVDSTGTPISDLFKLYPWEDMLHEPFGELAYTRQTDTRFIEPAWKVLLSNKALLATLWQLNPGHPLLLPARLGDPGDMTDWVAKPLWGREGDNIRIHADGVDTATSGPYGDEGFCYQQYARLAEFGGGPVVLGSWVVDGQPAGLGIRESDSPITDWWARFVPHVIV